MFLSDGQYPHKHNPIRTIKIILFPCAVMEELVGHWRLLDHVRPHQSGPIREGKSLCTLIFDLP